MNYLVKSYLCYVVMLNFILLTLNLNEEEVFHKHWAKLVLCYRMLHSHKEMSALLLSCILLGDLSGCQLLGLVYLVHLRDSRVSDHDHVFVMVYIHLKIHAS